MADGEERAKDKTPAPYPIGQVAAWTTLFTALMLIGLKLTVFPEQFTWWIIGVMTATLVALIVGLDLAANRMAHRSSRSLSAFQERRLPLSLSPSAAFDRCVEALFLFKKAGATLIEEDRAAGVVRMRTKMRMATMPETITFRITVGKDGRTRVAITSEPWPPWLARFLRALPAPTTDGGSAAETVDLAGTFLAGSSAKPALEVAVKASLHRCPYCHDEASPAESVVCSACLARHHEACFGEHQQCASCGGVEYYGGLTQAGGRAPSAQRNPKGKLSL